ncbi:MAG: transglutaminase-like domain-containing protein [Planctomycetota bacterium]
MASPDSSGRLRREACSQGCFYLLVAIALFLSEWVYMDPRDPAHRWIFSFMTLAAIGAIARTVVGRLPIRFERSARNVIYLLAIALPIASSWSWSDSSPPGQPLERITFEGLRNLLLALAISQRGYRDRSIAVFAAAFIALFAATQSNHSLVMPTVSLFGMTGVTWMVLTVGSKHSRREIPVLPLGLVGVSFAAFCLLHGNQSATPSMVLAELLGSSGGTSRRSERALGGVGDGTNIVNHGELPESDGGTGNKIVESHLPTFYDAVTELYGEPVKRKDQQRAISLASQSQVTHQKAKHHQASREFHLQRHVRKRESQPTNRDATAIAYLTGPTPAHLRTCAYHDFNGEAWIDNSESVMHPVARDLRECWFRLEDTPNHPPTESVSYTLKLGNYSDRILPVPTHTRRFHVGLINRPDFFLQPQAGILWLADPAGRITGGETIEFECDVVDPFEVSFRPSSAGSDVSETSRRTENPSFPFLRRIAREWTNHARTDGERIRVIVDTLKSNYSLEPRGDGNLATERKLEDFLLKTKRGPDYLFATASAVLLRELGYTTRLAMGYYASPQRFDAWSRVTPIAQDDLHAWPEIFIGNSWVALEPTPGYDILQPRRTWLQTAIACWEFARSTVAEHSLALLIVTVAFCVLWRSRATVLDCLATCFWRVCLWLHPATSLPRTRWLIDVRLALASRPRPPWITPRRWYERCGVCNRGTEDPMNRFLSLLDEFSFAPESTHVDPQATSICSSVVEGFRAPREMLSAERFRIHFPARFLKSLMIPRRLPWT